MLRAFYRPVANTSVGASSGLVYQQEARQGKMLLQSKLSARPRVTGLMRPKLASFTPARFLASFSTQTAIRVASTEAKSLASKLDYKEVRIFGRAVAIIASSVAIGDFLAQVLELNFRDLFAVNIDKSWTMLLVGTAMIGPVTQGWHMLIEKKFPGDPVRNVAMKIILSSSYIILFQLPLICATNTLFTKDFSGSKGTLSEAVKKVKKDLVPTASQAMIYWPIMNLILFTVVSGYNRVLVRSIAAVGWKLYLTQFAINAKKKQLQTSWGRELQYSDHTAVWM